MANLSGLSSSGIDFTAFERLLSVVCDRLGMEAAWAGYLDDKDVVIGVTTGPTEKFGSALGSRTPWETAMGSGPSDVWGRPLTQRWMDDPDAIGGTDALPGSFLFRVAQVGPETLPVGFVNFAHSSLREKPGPSDMAEVAAVTKLFAQVVAPFVEADLRRRAIHDRITDEIADDRFEIVYQPVAETKTGRIVGAEALSRFSCAPQRPDFWFAEAASVGMGVELELAALKKALAGLDSLPPDAYVAVNVSPELFLHPKLRPVLAESTPSRVVLELTEHDAIDDYAAMIAMGQQYRDLGCQLAIDDVGAGFASLAHVLNLEPDLVKVDLALTSGIDHDLARRTLMKAIVDVADGIGAIVVAEGVETQAELDAVAELGVTHAQGYLLARPAPLPLPASTARAVSFHADEPAPLAGTESAAGRFELAFRHSPIGMALVDLDGRMVHVNPAMSAMLGYSPEEMTSKTYMDLTHPDDIDADVALAQECRDGVRDNYRIDKRYLASSGAVVWGDLSVVIVRSDDGTPLHFVSQIQDVTERRHREQRLARRAATDSLTGLANRSAGIERIQYLLDHDRSFGVVFCDMENFKVVNDQFGHDAGDQVLVTVAQRVRSAVRDSDTVVRWGGDEFIAIVTTDQRSLARTAERIREHVARPVTLQPDGHSYRPSITTGTAHRAEGEVISRTELIRQADMVMYETRDRDRLG